MPVFTANIPGILKVGDRIEIGGKIKGKAKKMSVNLCAQEGEEPRDVVLHFDVRFHRDNIISLSRKNGVWIGSGNYDTNYNMFEPGTIFRIIFEVKDTDVITIYCQGKFHSNFLPKIPLALAKFVVVWADVEKVTRCFFYMGSLSTKISGDRGRDASFTQPPQTPLIKGEKRCPRIHKKIVRNAPMANSSNDSSEENVKPQPKAEGRANRSFYETLMCVQGPKKMSLGTKYQNEERRKMDHNRSKDLSNTDTSNLVDSEEITSKNIDSSIGESGDVLQMLGIKKRTRRGKFSAPFAQVVNIIRTSKRD